MEAINEVDTASTTLPLTPEQWASIAAGTPLPVVADGEAVLLGLNSFEPGEEFANHLHEVLTETFIGIRGEVELWLDRFEKVVLSPGTVRSVPPGVEHYLRNATYGAALIAYVKSPNRPGDRVRLSWTPKEV